MRKTVFFILCLEGAILSFNVAAASALIPSVAKDFAVSQFAAGKIVWLYMLPYGFSALLYGPLVRLFDAKRVELICLFFFSLANLMTAFARNIYLLFAGRILMGIFGASVIPLALIIISKHIEPEKRGRYVGLFFGATFVASLAGLFLSGIIPWRWIFLIPAILGFILCIHIQVYLPSFKQDIGAFKINYLEALKNKTVTLVFAYIVCISVFYHGLQQWFSVYFSSRFQLSQFLISALITLTSLAGIFGEVSGGVLADKSGRLKTMNLGITLMILSICLLIFKSPFIILSLLMFIWGLGWTFNHAAVSTLLTDLPKEFLNEAASLNSSVRFISGGLGVALGGVILQQGFNFWIIFFGSGLLCLLFFTRKLII